MSIRFETREIGSLAKPSWRVKAFAGRPIEAADVAEAERWGRRLEVAGWQRLVELLKAPVHGPSELAQIADFAALYAIRLLERSGLDVVYDGEQRRSEMYDHVVTHARGFAGRGVVRSFDNKYYAKAAVVEPPSIERPYDLEEFRFARAHATRRLKVPLTGAYTIVDWSYDEHYQPRVPLGAGRGSCAQARRAFLRDVAERVVRPNAAGLVEAGADWVQIDEPAAAVRPDEIDLVVEGFNLARRGLAAKASLHVCFSDYRALWPAVLELEGCHELQLELANRDSRDLGVADAARPGYAPVLPLFRVGGSPNVGLGVLDVHTDFVEPSALVRDRILYAVHVLDDPTRIAVNPDCGLRTRTWDVAYEKLTRMVEGTRLAEAVLNRG